MFFADMQTADQEFRAASNDKGLNQPLVASNEEVQSRMARFGHYYRYFRELGRISGGTKPVIDQIKLQILPRLKKYTPDSNEGPIEIIRYKLEDWRGPEGSASYQFKNRYLPKLATAMETQYSVMQSMAAVMIAHEAVIDQARQKYLDLINNTTKAIGQIPSQQGSSFADLVVTVVNAVAAGFTVGGVIAEGPGAVAGAVFGLIQGVGTYIDNTEGTPTGGDWLSITGDTLDKLEAVVTAVKEETKKVEAALDEVFHYVTGEFRDQFLAPPVNLV